MKGRQLSNASWSSFKSGDQIGSVMSEIDAIPSHPTAPLREPIVLHFRRSLQARIPSLGGYVVHVSADNRFILYVNGHRVGDGPARGDLAHWRYETFDLAAVPRRGR